MGCVTKPFDMLRLLFLALVAASEHDPVADDFLARLSDLTMYAWKPPCLATQRFSLLLIESLSLQARQIPQTAKVGIFQDLVDRFFATLTPMNRSFAIKYDGEPLTESRAAEIAEMLDRSEELDGRTLDKLISSIKGKRGAEALVERLSIARIATDGFDMHRFRNEMIAMHQSTVSLNWALIFARVTNLVPIEVINAWDESFAIEFGRKQQLMSSVYSLRNVERKVLTISSYLSQGEYSPELEGAIASAVVWVARLRLNLGKHEELEAAVASLRSIDLQPALRVYRKHLGLFIPSDEISVADFKTATGNAAQRALEKKTPDSTVLHSIVMLESRIAALTQVSQGDAVDEYVTRVRKMQDDMVREFVKNLDEAAAAEAFAVPGEFVIAMERMTIAMTPRIFAEADNMVSTNWFDPNYRRACSIMSVVTSNSAEADNMRKNIQLPIVGPSLGFRLGVARTAMTKAKRALNAVVEGILANLAVWRYRLVNGELKMRKQQVETLTKDIDALINDSWWAFLEQRRLLGLPQFEITVTSDIAEVTRKVRAFINLPENQSVEKFTPIYYTAYEALRTRDLSLYVAILDGLANSKTSLSDTYTAQVIIRKVMDEKLLLKAYPE